jgi:hypothetical protein
MVVTDAPRVKNGNQPYGGQTLAMPSQRHSAVAKAIRYREDPERLVGVCEHPLTVVINGFHGTHTVVRIKSGLICSCERFRRGGGACGHVLAVDERFVASASAAAPAALARIITSMVERVSADDRPKPGMLENLVLPVWDLAENTSALMLARTLVQPVGLPYDTHRRVHRSE